MTATETGMIASPSRGFMVVPYPSGPGLLRPGLRFHISPQDVDDRDNPRIKSGTVMMGEASEPAICLQPRERALNI